MRFIALVSGGKDSIYSILQAIQNGHELIACLHLGAPEQTEEESYMYQTAGSSTVKTLVEECLQVDYILYQRRGKSVNTGLVYEATTEQDEVEDLFLALQHAKEKYKNNNLQAVCSGAILSTYQRVRIEHVCNRLGLTSLSYLWRLLPQKELLQQMLNDGIEAVVVKTACPPGLVPRKHLNKTLRYLCDIGLLERLHTLYQFHVCGEGGEYESLVLDSPLHKKKLVLDEVEIVETEEDGVGELRIIQCHAEEKNESDIPILQTKISNTQQDSTSTITSSSPSPRTLRKIPFCPAVSLPHVHQGNGGLLHVSEIMASVAVPTSNDDSEVDIAVNEALEIFEKLHKSLDLYGATAQDVLFVHLYLSEISHFATINTHYQNLFGTLLPPSRSCVAVGRGVLPGGRRVLLDCMVQLGSGEYMRSNNTENQYTMAAQQTISSKLREVLHVQSISHWAPVCVGPYSQTNTIRGGLHFMAGQIGLIPATMTLQPTWESQLDQCWINLASVLDALGGGSLKDICSSLIYVSDSVYQEENAMEIVESISTSQIEKNGAIIPGKVDTLENASEVFGGYEDEGTYEEMKKQGLVEEEAITPCPMLVVCLSEMPKGALVELEVITATVDASKSLDRRDATYWMEKNSVQSVLETNSLSIGWDTGHDFPSLKAINEDIKIEAFARVIDHGCAAFGVATASFITSKENGHIQLDMMLGDMLKSVERVLADARSGLKESNILHVRLFYVASEQNTMDGDFIPRDDGVELRSSLRSLVNSKIKNNPTATTVVPVRGIHISGHNTNSSGGSNTLSSTKFAMQVLVIDPVHLETEIWINKDREYVT